MGEAPEVASWPLSPGFGTEMLYNVVPASTPGEVTLTSARMEAPAGSTTNAAKTTPATILLVDDDADTRVSIRELLEDRGYHVVAFREGQGAYAYLRDNPPPHCIVLDLWMPVMDGWEFAAEVRGGKFAPIPIVVVTAAEALWRYPVSARYVLRKPLRPEALLSLIAEALEQADRR